jgi:hypothetical protein
MSLKSTLGLIATSIEGWKSKVNLSKLRATAGMHKETIEVNFSNNNAGLINKSST